MKFAAPGIVPSCEQFCHPDSHHFIIEALTDCNRLTLSEVCIGEDDADEVERGGVRGRRVGGADIGEEGEGVAAAAVAAAVAAAAISR